MGFLGLCLLCHQVKDRERRQAQPKAYWAPQNPKYILSWWLESSGTFVKDNEVELWFLNRNPHYRWPPHRSSYSYIYMLLGYNYLYLHAQMRPAKQYC